MSPSRAWDGSPIVSPFLSQSEAKSKNQEAKQSPDSAKASNHKREVTKGLGGTAGTLSQPLPGT